MAYIDERLMKKNIKSKVYHEFGYHSNVIIITGSDLLKCILTLYFKKEKIL